RPAVVSRAKVATNHQGAIEWSAHAELTRTLERERLLTGLADDPTATRDRFVRTFLESPIVSRDYEHAFGTLYTAEYEPSSGKMQLVWPSHRWRRSFSHFEETEQLIEYSSAENR